MSPRTANMAVAVHPLLAERWSPRSFDATHTISDEELFSLLEAARWAPSARNSQPWRFLVGRRGDTTYEQIFSTLMSGNRLWAGQSSLLVAAVAAERLEDGTPHHGAAYDTGLAVAQLAVQAHALGLHAHQMGGFHPEQLRSALGIPDGYRPLSITAIGSLAPAELLPQELRDRETAARERRPLADTFFAESWGNPLTVRHDG
ncbi:nitroreductase family protein [Streptomyces himalayensis]|uniref:Nitroreductase family protein n=1 Tax=Streptomyces himalayensis subsp. himalayensis TaxID=2756131 RepID=A0A7W0DIQ6_9ACTN|nr:nitroreductase family protein [Streptomyces himalayensis]MBA2945773.1 nitroreductase family protein [Streptomyces himalayensis subsp. himalayensis]